MLKTILRQMSRCSRSRHCLYWLGLLVSVYCSDALFPENLFAENPFVNKSVPVLFQAQGQADDNSNINVNPSSRVAVRAVAPKKRNSRRSRARVKPRTTANLSEAFQLDTADDLIQSDGPQGEIINSYRGLTYLKYFQDSIDVSDFDDPTSRSIAEKLLLYKCSKTISEFMHTSPLQEIYDDVIEDLTMLQDHATVQVSEQASGQLSINQPVGNNPSAGKRLVQFRVQSSIHRGIEPRLTIGDNLVLKYDFVQDRPYLLYQFNF